MVALEVQLIWKEKVSPRIMMCTDMYVVTLKYVTPCHFEVFILILAFLDLGGSMPGYGIKSPPLIPHP